MDERTPLAHQKQHGESSSIKMGMLRDESIGGCPEGDRPAPSLAVQEEPKAAEAIAFHGRRLFEVGNYRAAKRARRLSLGGDYNDCEPQSYQRRRLTIPEASDTIHYALPRRISTNASNSRIPPLQREVTTFPPLQNNHASTLHTDKIHLFREFSRKFDMVTPDIVPTTKPLPLDKEEPIPESLAEPLSDIKHRVEPKRNAPEKHATSTSRLALASNDKEACLGEDFVPGNWDVVRTGICFQICLSRKA
jgi:hypothetical protein